MQDDGEDARVAEDTALSVSQAMRLAKSALEGLALHVVGEISELTDRPGYKAVYFTVRDEGAVMSCLVWRDAYAASGVQLRTGMLVDVSGQFTVYPPKGRMQFQVRRLAAAGEGALRLQVAQLARRLEAEGLMQPERKRELPAFPERIGLVTSPRGKAVHDVIRTLRRRFPCAELVVAGVPVEGAGAVESIVAGLRAVAAEPGVDVVILARGGGSYEDLMPFNAEEVARAVAAMPVPVVTGIGHEPDTSIADMVADVRASTPTAAAEAVAGAQADLERRLADMRRLVLRGLSHNAQLAAHRLAVLGQRAVLRDPSVLLAVPAQRLDAMADALASAVPVRLERDASRVAAGSSALLRLGARVTERWADRVGTGAARLEDPSPRRVLSRGYAVCFDESGTRVVRSAGELSPGGRVVVELTGGRAGCRVETVGMEEMEE